MVFAMASAMMTAAPARGFASVLFHAGIVAVAVRVIIAAIRLTVVGVTAGF